MALKATIFKVELNIADMDRNYYADHQLTLARHPSESDARMMVRLLAFALNASESLQFTRGLCADDEPELWQKNLHDGIELWIDLGQPDERRIRRACNRAAQVIVYSYQPRSALPWWKQLQKQVSQHDNLQLFLIGEEQVSQLAALASRNMQLQCLIQDGEVHLSSSEQSVAITLQRLN